MKQETKDAILMLIDLGITLNEQGEYDVFIHYSGHTDQIDVRIRLSTKEDYIFNECQYLKGTLYSDEEFKAFNDKVTKKLIKLTK